MASLHRAPVLTVIESPDRPPVMLGRGRVRAVIFSLVLGVVVAIFVVYVREIARYLSRRAANDQALAEVFREVRAIARPGRRRVISPG